MKHVFEANRAVRLLVVLAGMIALVPACGPRATQEAFRQPLCRADNPTMILMAQAIPTAPLLPCIIGLPSGWRFESLDIRSGAASFWLDSDRTGTRALGVSLTAGCSPKGTPIPSDKLGAALFVKIDTLSPRYAGTRYYRFPQECLIYRFNFPGESRAMFTTDATDSIGLVSRSEVQRRVHQLGGEL